jgi:hypothetical protein
MPAKKKIKINIKKFIRDIRSGATEYDIMNKYELTSQGIQRAFTKLIKAGAISYEELCKSTTKYQDTCEVINDRDQPRNSAIFEIPIIDVRDRDNFGWIIDVTEQGLQVFGLETQFGNKMKLLIFPEGLEDLTPFTLEAECQWTNEQIGETSMSAGFLITNISKEGMEHLKSLIDFMTISF